MESDSDSDSSQATHLKLYTQKDQSYYDNRVALAIIYDPSLAVDVESISLTGEYYNVGGEPAMESAAVLVKDTQLSRAPITHLDFLDCSLESECISKLMSFSNGLEEFRYVTGGDHGETIYVPELGRALGAFRETLRVLVLNCDHQVMPTYTQSSYGLGIWTDRSFADNINNRALFEPDYVPLPPYEIPTFPHLTHLTIGVKTLFGMMTTLRPRAERLIDWIPASFEELSLLGYHSGLGKFYTNQVEELVEKRAERLPNLKVLSGVDVMLGPRSDDDLE